MDVDIRYLPGQDRGAILAQIRAIGDVEIVRCFERAPAIVSRTNPYVLALREAVQTLGRGRRAVVGRDGASDAISFLEAGIPAVEFGPIGGGHHGPNEWVSLSSLTRYRAGARRLRAAPARAAGRRRHAASALRAVGDGTRAPLRRTAPIRRAPPLT